MGGRSISAAACLAICLGLLFAAPRSSARPSSGGSRSSKSSKSKNKGAAASAALLVGASSSGSKYKCTKSDPPECKRKERACFPGSATVTTETGPKLMRDLRLGDAILTLNDRGMPTFQPVFAFSSRRPDDQATFVCVTAANRTVCATPAHYALEEERGLVTFADLRVGDVVRVRLGERVHPVAVDSVHEKADLGLFNPHTKYGVVVVDDVAVSELTAFVPPWLARCLPGAFEAVHTSAPSAVNALAKWVSKMAHGVPDAACDA